MAAAKTSPIVEWLHENGLDAYESQVVELKLQKEDLRLLENDDEIIDFCHDIGIQLTIHKKKMQHAIKQLQIGMTTNVVVITKEIENILCNMKQLSSQLIRMEKQLLNHKQSIETEANDCTHAIEQHFDPLIAALKNRKNASLQQLNAFKATKINQSNIIHQKILNHKQKVHEKQQKLAQLATNSKANERVIKNQYDEFVQSDDHKEIQNITIDTQIKFNFGAQNELVSMDPNHGPSLRPQSFSRNSVRTANQRTATATTIGYPTTNSNINPLRIQPEPHHTTSSTVTATKNKKKRRYNLRNGVNSSSDGDDSNNNISGDEYVPSDCNDNSDNTNNIDTCAMDSNALSDDLKYITDLQPITNAASKKPKKAADGKPAARLLPWKQWEIDTIKLNWPFVKDIKLTQTQKATFIAHKLKNETKTKKEKHEPPSPWRSTGAVVNRLDELGYFDKHVSAKRGRKRSKPSASQIVPPLIALEPPNKKQRLDS
eukprot:1043205_1